MTVRYYRASDICVLLLLRESLSTVLIEVMSCGLAVVTTRLSGNNDLSPYNIKEIANKLKILRIE